MHIIWTGGLNRSDRFKIKKEFKNNMKDKKCKCILTFLEMQRHHCVSKETYDNYYKEGGELDEESCPFGPFTPRMKISLGDDIENFASRSRLPGIESDEIGNLNLGLSSFHLALLEKEDQKKLTKKNEDFLSTFRDYAEFKNNPDVPKEKMEISESKSKYIISRCERVTFVL